MAYAAHVWHCGGIAYPRYTDVLVLHLAVGTDLVCLRVDRNDLSLHEISRLTLAAPVQYVWPHPRRNLFYVACSNRPISKADNLHLLATVTVDKHNGTMLLLAQVPLPTRPIHLTLDNAAGHALVVYNAPARITAHAIDADGRAGEVLAQSPEPRVGVFPHQVLMLPSRDGAVVVVARGNHAVPGRDEEPGSFEFFALDGERLTHTASAAPRGGRGFGPRHLEFHPDGCWAAVSVERHNELHIYSVVLNRFADEPAFRASTLDVLGGDSYHQLCGAVHFHPSGRFLYVVNRHDTAVYGDSSVPSLLAGNNIAVFAFHSGTGRLELLQHVPTESVHVRTFSFDASGELLVAASILPALARCGDAVERVPSRLTFYRCAPDGRLSLARVQNMDNEDSNLFWSHLNGSVISS